MNPSASSATPESASDHFEALGLEPGFDLDSERLETSYLELSARFHPDRFAGASDRERRQAMERSAVLNEAYRVLRDPVRRAEYMVKLGGIDLDSEDPARGAPAADQGFLVEMLERREQLEQLHGEGPAQVNQMLAGVEDEAEETLARAIEALATGDIDRAARALVARRYLQRLIDEIEGGPDEL